MEFSSYSYSILRRSMINTLKESLKKQFPWFWDIWKQITAKTWEKGSIVYYTGNHKDGITPYSLTEGTSGSKAAVIFLSREWAKLGYKVTVYSTCGDREGIYDGVEYKNYYYFNPCDRFDVLIIFQHASLLPNNVKARKLCFEWQDILGGEKQYPREKLLKFDKIFAKSQFQRNLMDFVTDDKFVIVTNGIDPSIIELSKNEKDPYRLVYASRYYRGLDSMLTFGWPIIKREIPEAELHIYYGFVRRELGKGQTEWREMMKQLMQQEGVIDHGKIGQDQLILEKSKSSIHYYACTYPEIDCISVRESAVVGCVPVTTDFAVLAEKNYCVKVSGEPSTKETQEAVAYKIIELLKNQEKLATIRQEFIEAAKQETWDRIAQVWLENFRVN
jgi:glycosyltransferase involved in cell wall biosynthesis